MPELPEVETTRRDLEKILVGDSFTGEGFSDWKKQLHGPSELSELLKIIKGKKILSVERRAKILIFNLSGGKSLLTHFKMTGHYLVVSPKVKCFMNERPAKIDTCLEYPALRRGLKMPTEEAFQYYQSHWDRFIHQMFRLQKSDLLFTDIRKFGWIKTVNTDQINKVEEISKLGPEPLGEDLTFEYLREQFSKSDRKIKQVLMDQSVIAGIGNIYADEILWEAKVHPEFSSNKLSVWQINSIFNAIKPVLERGLKYTGSSIGEYRRIDNSLGTQQNYLNVYGREGEPCKRDGAILERVVVGQRSAIFCPKEQKLN